MHRRPYLKASIMSSVLLLFTSTLLFSIVSLRLGEGFGREVNMIVNQPPQTHALHDFLDELSNTPIEVYAYPMSGNRTMIKLIGVNDIQGFLENFRTELNDVFIETVGTFGTLSSISTNIKLFQLYFVVFLFGYILYATYRYQRTGFAISISIATVLIFTMFITNIMGFLLNNIMWMALLLSFVFLLMQKQYVVNKLSLFFTQEPDDYVKSVKDVLNASLYFGLVLSVIGLLLVFFAPAYINAAIVFLIVSVWLVIERVALLKFLPFFMLAVVKDPNLREGFLPRASLFRATPLFANLVMRGFLLGSVVIVIISGSSLIFTEPKLWPTHTNHILVVQDSAPVSFLEVQASLHKYGLEDNLYMYRVSEEKTTWFKFEGLTNRHALDLVRYDLMSKTSLESSVYSYVDEPTVSTSMRYGSIGVSIAALFGLHLVYKDKKQRVTLFGLSLLTTLLFMLVSYFLGVFGDKLFTLSLWVAPFLTASSLFFYYSSHKVGLDPLKNIVSVVAILILPMIVIIPLTNTAAYLQIRIFASYSLALCTTILFMAGRYKR
jgi:hypothetical protein